jgi:hypothetical protein
MKLSRARRLAYVVILGELEGGVWDWRRGTFVEPQ